jgi:hypothetical protein
MELVELGMDGWPFPVFVMNGGMGFEVVDVVDDKPKEVE